MAELYGRGAVVKAGAAKRPGAEACRKIGELAGIAPEQVRYVGLDKKRIRAIVEIPATATPKLNESMIGLEGAHWIYG